MREHIVAARALAGRPSCIPQGRPRGAKAQGIRYEKVLGAVLPFAVQGQWWEYQEGSGRSHYCQTDLVFEAPGEWIVILEAKYTWTIEGHIQLQKYCRVVEMALHKHAIGIVVAKRLVPGMPYKAVEDLADAVAPMVRGAGRVWHWIGKGTPAIPKGAGWHKPTLYMAPPAGRVTIPPMASIGL